MADGVTDLDWKSLRVCPDAVVKCRREQPYCKTEVISQPGRPTDRNEADKTDKETC
jgi:hypothetical protein